MSSETGCDKCGRPESSHADQAANTLATLLIFQKLVQALPTDHVDTLTNVLTDWRSHSLPSCDPMSID